MSGYSIIIAGSMQHAINSAVTDWHWEQTGNPDFRLEFRRPDNGERVRWAGEHMGLRGLPWNTTLYQGHGWEQRRDRREVEEMLRIGYLRLGEPELHVPVRKPRPKLPTLQELQHLISGRYDGGR